MKRVFVNGYGSIGGRVVSFLRDDPEIEVVGVGKYSPDERVSEAVSKGLAVYVPKKSLGRFGGFKIAGTIESALDGCDLVIDASPGGRGFANKKSLYEPRNLHAISQGGASVSGDAAGSALLVNSRAN